MAKKVKKTKSWGFSSSEASFDRYITQFMNYMEKEEFSNAEGVLEKMERNFPFRKEVLMCGLKLANELDDMAGFYEKAEEFIAKYPDDPQGYMALVDLYHEEDYHLLYCDMMEKFCDRFGGDSSVLEIEKSISNIKFLFSEVLEDMELEGDNAINIALLMEKSQFLLDIGKAQESCKILENLIIEQPNFLPAFNQLSQTFFILNNVNKAIEIAQKGLEKDANNYIALGNLVHFHTILGETNLAEKYLTQLKKLDNDHYNIYLEKAEAMAWYGDDEALVELGKEAELLETSEDLTPELSEISEDLTAEFWHYIAVGYANLGDEKKARQLWKKSLKLDSDFECAEDNLKNLTLPAGEKINSWAFEFHDWIPLSLMENVYNIKNQVNTSDEIIKLFEKYPYLISLIPILVKRGNSTLKKFALLLCLISEKAELMPILQEFAFSQNGTDEERMDVMESLVDRKFIPSGKVTIWFKGKQKEVLFLAVEIHDRRSIEHSPKVSKLLQKAIDVIREEENGKKAELLLLDALKLEPSAPDLQFYLAGACILQDRKEEAIELLQKIHQEYPSYPYTRLSLAQSHIDNNELEEAEELLKPLLEKKEFHYQEFATFCELYIHLAIKKKDFKEANCWLEMWGRMGYEDSRRFNYWRDELKSVKIKL
ncbi:tetratricopeptide repeat protein [Geminocystis sp. CENA526]|uniref:tetratricopeptide repeat protein n=1 Tax=Geminocystis sp. CENA526 TaxID=1355871 RepID=UPI003D6F4358